ncbi:hypothetical protein M9C81_04340 [SAR86 cluster bacterium]|nr:hypothetical protein M9C81_04340 [SAR86 cluster bacterium]
MSSHVLDLHGYRHHEVDIAVENFVFLNQEEMPLTIICGNSEKMLSLVRTVLDRTNAEYYNGVGHEYGQIKVHKLK